MAKAQTSYVCQQCGAAQSKWTGKCGGCGDWNTLVQETQGSVPKGADRLRGQEIECSDLQTTSPPASRVPSGIAEFDRVCGGGLVPGSVLLVGGDPGIGKSTLLLQVAALMHQHVPSLYISGEEAVDQIRMRAQRLGVGGSALKLASATNVNDILRTLDKPDAPGLVVIDSIQTMFVENLDSAPGSVSQVRLVTQELTRLAKQRNITMIIVGHVTKEGSLAGPRVLEHMVDTVLYFEGERGHQFRILRSVKNRFGATDEIGVFEMSHEGLTEVHNPSSLFLSERQENVSGSTVFAGVEGTRPLLVEIQALVSPSSFATSRRAVIGWDSGRLAMILAVLETRCGVLFGPKDVYLNVAGGLRIQEPAADLAVAAALFSALKGIPLSKDAVFFGEIGLSGEVRPVGQAEARLKEAAKLGFEKAYIPLRSKKTKGKPKVDPLEVNEFRFLKDFLGSFCDNNIEENLKGDVAHAC